MNDWYMIFLRLLHVGGGVLWTGAAIMLAAYIEPVVRSMGPDGGRFMEGLTLRKFHIFMSVNAWASVIAGFLLYWRISGHVNRDWLETGPGVMFTVGGLIALGVALAGQLINAPTGIQISRLGAEMKSAGGPPSADQIGRMQALQHKMRTVSQVEAVLLLIVIVTMAVGRYIHL
jgi:hypothetical protein